MSSVKLKISTLLVLFLSAFLIFFGCNSNPYKNLKITLSETEKEITLVDGDNEGENTFSIVANVTGRNKGYNGEVNFEVVGLENVIEKVNVSDVSDGATTALFHAKDSGSATIRVTTKQGNKTADVKITVIREINSFEFTTNVIPVPRGELVDLKNYIKFNPTNTSQKNIKAELVQEGASLELNKIYNENGMIRVGSDVNLNSFDVVVTSADKPEVESIRATVKVVDMINKEFINIKYNNGTEETADDIILNKENGVFKITLAPNTSDVSQKKIYFDFNGDENLNDKYIVSARVGSNNSSVYVDVDDYKDNSFLLKGIGLGKETITFKIVYKDFPNSEIFTQEIKLNVEVLTYPTKLSALDEAGKNELSNIILYKNYTNKRGTAVKSVVLDGNNELVGQKFNFSFNKIVNDKIIVMRQDGTVVNPNTDIVSGTVLYIKHFYKDGETLPTDLKIKFVSSAYEKVFVEVPVIIDVQEIDLQVESTEIKIDKNNEVVTPENPYGPYGYKEINFTKLPQKFDKNTLVVEGVNSELLGVNQSDTVLGFFSKGVVGENTVRIISPNGQVISIHIIVFEALDSNITYIQVANNNIMPYVEGGNIPEISLKNNLNIKLGLIINNISYNNLPGGLKIQTVSSDPKYVIVNSDGLTLTTRELEGGSTLTVKITGFDENGLLTREITYKFKIMVQIPINTLTTDGNGETTIYDLKNMNDPSILPLGSYTINLRTQPYNASFKLEDMQWYFLSSAGSNYITPDKYEDDEKIIYSTTFGAAGARSIITLTIQKSNFKQAVVTVSLNSGVQKEVFFVVCRIAQKYTNENGVEINDFKETTVKLNLLNFVSVENIILNDVSLNQARIPEIKFDSRYMGLVGDTFTKNNTKTISYSILPAEALFKKVSATSSSTAVSVEVNSDNTITLTANRRNIENNDIYITINALDSRNTLGQYTKYIKVLVRILDGTVENPYEIGTAKELYELDDMSAHYVLTNNINISSYYPVWKPIGSAAVNNESAITPFMGSLNGEYSIKNEDGEILSFQYGINGLNFKNSENTFGHNYVGLFAYLGSSAVIKNLFINDIKINFNDISQNNNNIYIGAVAGFSEGTIENVSVSDGNNNEKLTGLEIDSISSDSKGIWIAGTTQNSKSIFVGGLVGFLNNANNASSAQILNSNASILINSVGVELDQFIGGFVGYNNKAVIEKNNAEGLLFGYSSADAISIINPYSRGTNYASNSSFGGVVGYNNGTINGITARAIIYGNKNIGGVAGSNSGKIINNISMPVLRGVENIGGLIGNNSDVVQKITINYEELVGSILTPVTKIYENTGIEANYAARDAKLKIEKQTREQFINAGNELEKYTYNVVESNKVEFVLFETNDLNSNSFDKVSQYNTAIIGQNSIGGLIGVSSALYNTSGSIDYTQVKMLDQNNLSIDFKSVLQFNSVYSYINSNVITDMCLDAAHDILDQNNTEYLKGVYYGDIVLQNAHLNSSYADYTEGNINRNVAGGLIGTVNNGYVNNTNAKVNIQASGAILGGVVGTANGYYLNRDVSLDGNLINRSMMNVENATGNFIGDATNLNSKTKIENTGNELSIFDTYAITAEDKSYLESTPDNKNAKEQYHFASVTLNNENTTRFYNIITSYSLMNVNDTYYYSVSLGDSAAKSINHGFVGIGEKTQKTLTAYYQISSGDWKSYEYEKEIENVLAVNSFYLNLDEDIYFKWELTRGSNTSNVYAKYDGILQENFDFEINGNQYVSNGKSIFSVENIMYLSQKLNYNTAVIPYYADSSAAGVDMHVKFNIFNTKFENGVGNITSDNESFNPNAGTEEFMYSNIAQYGVSDKNVGYATLFDNVEFKTYYYNEASDGDENGINDADETSTIALANALRNKNWYSNNNVTNGLPILLNKERYVTENGFHKINLIYNYPPSDIVLSLKDNKDTTWVYAFGQDNKGLIINHNELDSSNYINGTNIINFGNNNAGLTQAQISEYTNNVNAELNKLNSYLITDVMNLKTIPAFLGITNLTVASSNQNILSVENVEGKINLVAKGTGKVVLQISSIYNPDIRINVEINVVRTMNTMDIQQTINGKVVSFENNHTVNLTKSTSNIEKSIVLRATANGTISVPSVPNGSSLKLTNNSLSGTRYFLLSEKTLTDFENGDNYSHAISSVYWTDDEIGLETYKNVALKINNLNYQVLKLGNDRNLVYVDVASGVDITLSALEKTLQSFVAVPYVVDGNNKIVLANFINETSNVVSTKSIFAKNNNENIYVFGLAKSNITKLFNVNVINGTHEINVSSNMISFEPQNTRNFEVTVKTDNICTEPKYNADGSRNINYFVDESLYLNYLSSESKTLNIDNLFIDGTGTIKIGKVTLSVIGIERDGLAGTKTYQFMLEVKDEDKIDETLNTIENSITFNLNYFTAKVDANITMAADGIHITNSDLGLIKEFETNISIVLNPQPIKNIDVKHYPNSEYERITNDNGEVIGGKIDLSEIAYNNIIPGQVGVLKINIAPYFSKFDYVDIISSGSGENIISFEQVLANYSIIDNQKVFNGIYTTRTTVPEQVPGGIRLLRLSNISNLGEIDFDGNVYVKTLINSKVSESTNFTVTINIYSKTNNEPTLEKTTSIDLNVISPPGLELIYNEFDGKPVIARGTSVKFKAKLTAVTGEIDFSESHISTGANTNLGGYGSAFTITSLGNNEYELKCSLNIKQGYQIRVIGKINKIINAQVYRNKDEINFRVANFVVHEIGVKNVVNGFFQGRFYQSYPLIVEFSNVSYNENLVGVEKEIKDLELKLSIAKYNDYNPDNENGKKYSTWYQVTKNPNGSSTYTNVKTTPNFVINETSLGEDYGNAVGYTLQNIVYNSGDTLAAVVKLVYGENGATPATMNYNNGNPSVEEGEDFNSDYFVEMECSFGFGFYRLSNEKQPEPITSVSDLMAMQSGVDYILLNDLTLNNWEPLPDSLSINSLDGNGYVITINSFKLASETATTGNIGLFSSISSSTTIKNLTIEIAPDRQNVDISDEAIKSVEDNKADLLVDATNYQNVNFGILAGTNEGIVTNVAVVYDAGLLKLERDIAIISKTKIQDSNYSDYFETNNNGDVLFNSLKYALNNFETYFPHKYLINRNINEFDNINEFVSSSNTIFKTGERRDLSIVKINTNTISTSYTHYMGGLVGLNSGYITNSRVDNISINGIGYVGGLVAQNNKKISSSYFKGGNIQNRANAKINENSGTGGLVAINTTGSSIQYSYVLGREGDGNDFQIGITYVAIDGKNITVPVYTQTNYSDKTGISSVVHNGTSDKHQFAGHLYNTNANKTDYSYEVGALRAMNSSISSSTNTGGFTYQNDGIISNSYSNILVNSSASTSGFVYSNNTNGSIADCYSLSSTIVSSTSHSPFVGRDNNNKYNNLGTVSYSQYLKIGSGDNDSSLETTYGDIFLDDNEPATKLSASQFKEYNTFQGFAFNTDFNNNVEITRSVWFIPNGSEATKNSTTQISVLQKKFYSDFYIQNRPELVAANLKTTSIRVLVSSASTSQENQYDYISTPIGTNEQNPFLIRTAEEFNMYVAETLKSPTEPDKTLQSSSIRFISDIVFNQEDLKAITYNIDYIGDFDGNGMDIKQLRIISDSDFETGSEEILKLGLFGSITTKTINKVKYRGIVRNINIDVSEVRGTNVQYVGALAGIVNNGSAFNINVTGSEVVQGKHVVGGVFGIVAGESEIVNITSSVSAQSTYYKNANTYNANNNYVVPKGFEILNVDTTETENSFITNINHISYAGGIAGVIDVDKRSESSMSKTSIRNARARKIVVNDNVIVTGEIVGGIFGYVGKNSSVSDLTFEISSTNSTSQLKASRIAGGIVGENRGRIERSIISHASVLQTEIDNEAKTTVGDYYSAASYDVDNSAKNYNDLFKGNPHYIGGAVGFNNGGTIINSYSKVNVINMNAMIAGGFIGANIGGTVQYDYTTGSVSAFKVVGGFIGVQFTNNIVQKDANGTYSYLENYSVEESGITKTEYTGLFTGNLFFDMPIDHFVLSNLNQTKATNLYQVIASNIWRKQDLQTSREKYTANDVRFGAFVGEVDQHLTSTDSKFDLSRTFIIAGTDTRQENENNFFIQPFLNTASGRPTVPGETTIDYSKLAHEIGTINATGTLNTSTNTSTISGDNRIINRSINYAGMSGEKADATEPTKVFYAYSRLQNIGSARTLKEIIERRFIESEAVYMGGETITVDSNKTYYIPKIYPSWSNTIWAGVELSGALTTTNNSQVELIRGELVFPKLEIKPETSVVYVTKASDLLLMNKYPNADFVLMNDVDLEDGTIAEYNDTGWVPVGNAAVPFTGRIYSQFNSAENKYNSFTIKNLTIKTATDHNVGLVGYAKETNFHDFNLEVKGISIDESAGGSGNNDDTYYHIGTLYGFNDTLSVVKNIHVTGVGNQTFTITSNNVASIGGIAGTSLYSSFDNCSVENAVINVTGFVEQLAENATSSKKAEIGYVGGVVGRLSSSEYKIGESYTAQNLKVNKTTINVLNNATTPISVTAKFPNTNIQIGGIIGSISNENGPASMAGLQIDSSSKLKINLNFTNNANVNNLFVGGMVGGATNGSINNKVLQYDLKEDLIDPIYVNNVAQNDIKLNTNNYKNNVYLGGAFGSFNGFVDYSVDNTDLQFGSAKNIKLNNIVSYTKTGTATNDSKQNNYFGGVFGNLTEAKVGNIIVSENSQLNVETSSATGVVLLDNAYYGGVAGKTQNLHESSLISARNSINIGTVNVNNNINSNNTFVGGIYGSFNGSSTNATYGMKYAVTNAKIKIHSLSQTGTTYVGGISGTVSNTNVQNSISNAEIYINNNANKQIEDISKRDKIYAGGLFGISLCEDNSNTETPVELKNNYSTGYVEFDGGMLNSTFGGFVGAINYKNNAKQLLANIQNNYSITKLIANKVDNTADFITYNNQITKGGFVGEIVNTATGAATTTQSIRFANNYYNEELVPYGTGFAHGLSVKDMLFENSNTFVGFGVDNWNITAFKYPLLKWASSSVVFAEIAGENNLVSYDDISYIQAVGTHQNPVSVNGVKDVASVSGQGVNTSYVITSKGEISKTGGMEFKNANVYYYGGSNNGNSIKNIDKYSVVYGMNLLSTEADKTLVVTNNGMLINTKVESTNKTTFANKVTTNNGIIEYMPVTITTETPPAGWSIIGTNNGIVDKAGVEFNSSKTTGKIFLIGKGTENSVTYNSYIKNNVPDHITNGMETNLVDSSKGLGQERPYGYIYNSYERRPSNATTGSVVYRHFSNKTSTYIDYGYNYKDFQEQDTNINAWYKYILGEEFNFETDWTYFKNGIPRLQWEFKEYYLDEKFKDIYYWESGNVIEQASNKILEFRNQVNSLNSSKVLNITSTNANAAVANEERAKQMGLMSYMATTGLTINSGRCENSNENTVYSYALRSKTKPQITTINGLLVLSHVPDDGSAVEHIDLNKGTRANAQPSYNPNEALTAALDGVTYVTCVNIVNGELTYETKMLYNFNGVTVNLTGNIDFSNKFSNPIGFGYDNIAMLDSIGTNYENSNYLGFTKDEFNYAKNNSNAFSGVFNGNNFVLSNLNIITNKNAGLFGTVDYSKNTTLNNKENAAIRNLKLKDGNVMNTSTVVGDENKYVGVAGGVVGKVIIGGVRDNNQHIFNHIAVESVDVSASGFAGGIYGTNHSTINNSASASQLVISESYYSHGYVTSHSGGITNGYGYNMNGRVGISDTYFAGALVKEKTAIAGPLAPKSTFVFVGGITKTTALDYTNKYSYVVGTEAGYPPADNNVVGDNDNNYNIHYINENNFKHHKIDKFIENYNMFEVWTRNSAENKGYPILQNQIEYWVDYAKEVNVQTGVDAGKYFINTPEELAWVAKQVNEGVTFAGETIVLMNNINLSGKMWNPMGYKSPRDGDRAFRGTITSLNEDVSIEIYNLTANGLFEIITDPADATVIIGHNLKSIDYQGLFGYTDGATIKNIILKNHTYSKEVGYGMVFGKDYVGGLVGYAQNTKILNCTNQSYVTGNNNVGGIAGRIIGTSTTAQTKIENSTNEGVVSGTSNLAGGIAGMTGDGVNGDSLTSGGVQIQGSIPVQLLNNKNTGEVTGINYVGGITGKLSYNSIINGVNNYGTFDNNANIIGGHYVGGIAGVSCGEITNITNSGTVEGVSNATGKSGKIGGIVGYNNGDVYEVINKGNVTSNIADNVGGIIGYNFDEDSVDKKYIQIVNALNNAESLSNDGNKTPGGIIGSYSPKSISSANFKNCVSTTTGVYAVGTIANDLRDTTTSVVAHANNYLSDEYLNYGKVGSTDHKAYVQDLFKRENSNVWSYNSSGINKTAFTLDYSNTELDKSLFTFRNSDSGTVATITFSGSAQANKEKYENLNRFIKTRPNLSYEMFIDSGAVISTATAPLGNSAYPFTGIINKRSGTGNANLTLTGGNSFISHVNSLGNGTETTISNLNITINQSVTDDILVNRAIKVSLNNIVLNAMNSAIVNSSSEITGAAVGQAINSMFDTVQNNVPVTSNNNYTGGILGWGDNVTLQNCENLSNITGQEKTGGIIGEIGNSLIKSASNNGVVSGTDNVGGIVGLILSSTSSDESKGIVGTTNGMSVSGTANVGGIAGKMNGSVLFGAVNEVKGIVTSAGNNVGGIAGSAENSKINAITMVNNIGNIKGNSYVGGIIGLASNTTINGIDSNYNVSNSGTVNAENTDAGGIVGNISGGSIDWAKNTYFVESKNSIGGIAGYSSSTISNCLNAGENNKGTAFVNATIENTTGCGGIVGYQGGGQVKNCTNSGIVACKENKYFTEYPNINGNNTEREVQDIYYKEKGHINYTHLFLNQESAFSYYDSDDKDPTKKTKENINGYDKKYNFGKIIGQKTGGEDPKDCNITNAQMTKAFRLVTTYEFYDEWDAWIFHQNVYCRTRVYMLSNSNTSLVGGVDGMTNLTQITSSSKWMCEIVVGISVNLRTDLISEAKGRTTDYYLDDQKFENPTKEYFKVKFMSEDENGNEIEFKSLSVDKTVPTITLPNPTNAGKTFLGWYTGKNGTGTKIGDASINYNVSEDITLYAKWSANPMVTVYYKDQNKHLIEAIAYDEGIVLNSLRVENPTNKQFQNWYTVTKKDFEDMKDNKETYENYILKPEEKGDNKGKYVIRANMVLYAYYKVNVEFVEADGTTTVAGVATQEIEEFAKATKPKDPNKDGHTFEGWYRDSAFTVEFNFNNEIEENTKVYAKWIKNEIDVTFKANGGKFGASTNDVTITVSANTSVNASGKLPENPTRENYVFDGWYINNKVNAGDPDSYTKYNLNSSVSEAITLVAKWKPVENYVVTVKNASDASVNYTYTNMKYGYDGIDPTKITVPSGMYIDGFYYDQACSAANKVNLNSKIFTSNVLYVKFNAVTANQTVNVKVFQFGTNSMSSVANLTIPVNGSIYNNETILNLVTEGKLYVSSVPNNGLGVYDKTYLNNIKQIELINGLQLTGSNANANLINEDKWTRGQFDLYSSIPMDITLYYKEETETENKARIFTVKNTLHSAKYSFPYYNGDAIHKDLMINSIAVPDYAPFGEQYVVTKTNKLLVYSNDILEEFTDSIITSNIKNLEFFVEMTLQIKAEDNALSDAETITFTLTDKDNRVAVGSIKLPKEDITFITMGMMKNIVKIFNFSSDMKMYESSEVEDDNYIKDESYPYTQLGSNFEVFVKFY